jgi:hypothetical protein
MDLAELTREYGEVIQSQTAPVYLRRLSMNEYDKFVKLNNNSPDISKVTYDAEEFILRSAIIPAPTEAELDALFEYSNSSQPLIAEITALAGFENIELFVRELKTQRESVRGLVKEQVVAFISKAMPVYTIKEIQDMNYRQLAYMLALSEEILGMTFPGFGDDTPKKNSILE